MKKSDWVRWRQLSQNARLLDTNLQACDCVKRGWYNCDCEQLDFQRWDLDFLYQRRFQPRPVRPVNKNGAFVATRDRGRIEGPFLYTEWLEYSYFLFDLCHDIMDNKKQPDRSEIAYSPYQIPKDGVTAPGGQAVVVVVAALVAVVRP